MWGKTIYSLPKFLHMKNFTLIFVLALLIGGLSFQEASAQGGFLKKLKKKAEEKAAEKIFGEEKQDNSGIDPITGERVGSNTNSPTNTKGAGLTTEPPDVKDNIDEADKSYSGKQYADARYAVRQAILGIELEIGNNILESFPENINGLPALKDEDMVASTGIGFVGLLIERTYRQGDKQFKVTVGNESALMAGVNMYLSAGGGYANTQDQDHKTVKLGEHRGVIEYDESTGYKLSVPFGQSSILVAEGINFKNEGEMMSAAEQINIDQIQKELGEE